MSNKYSFAFIAIFSLVAVSSAQANHGDHKVSKESANSGMVLPATTSSKVALKQYLAAWADFENSRFISANAKFMQAAASDSSFTMAHMMVGLSGASTETFTSNLKKAADSMGEATPAEQLFVKSFEQAFAGDTEGMIASRVAITELHPDSPRAWTFLANAYGGVRNSEDARAAFLKAVQLSPKFVPAHTGLGNSLMNQDPKDFAAAEQHFMHAVAITPNEPNPHDLLGDIHRAQNKLEAAYDDYTKAAELAPELGAGYQQRGHVNSFLGKYDEARADYTRAAALEDARGSNAGGFLILYRAFVSVHEGDTAAAVDELKALAAGASENYTEGVVDLQVNVLSNAVLFATESGDSETASALIDETATLMRQQAKELGSDEFADAQEATIAYMQGILAARTGDVDAAAARAKEFEQHVASSTNPRKLERMHEISGLSAYYQGNFDAAVEHLSGGNNQANIYNKYHLAMAQKAAGNADEAAQLFGELAVYNFNSPGFALFRKSILKNTE